MKTNSKNQHSKRVHTSVSGSTPSAGELTKERRKEREEKLSIVLSMPFGSVKSLEKKKKQVMVRKKYTGQQKIFSNQPQVFDHLKTTENTDFINDDSESVLQSIHRSMTDFSDSRHRGAIPFMKDGLKT